VFRKKARGQKAQIKKSRYEEEVALDFKILHLRIEISCISNFYSPFLFLLHKEMLLLLFGSAGFFSEYICLRPDSRLQLV